MKIEVFEKIKNENIDIIRFILDGVSVELANAFRRIILTEIPTMAINEVLFVDNDSVLFDEFLAHRLGLIPLTTDLKNYNLPEECSCSGQGCSLCQSQFMLEVHTGNESEIISVTSKNLEPMDPKIKPVNDNIILAKLGKNTSLVFEAYAQLGKGKDHAKYQPVCSIGYKYFPDIKIDHSKFKSEEEIDEVINKDHTKQFIKKNGKLALVKDYWKGPDFTRACEKYAPEGAVRLNYIPNKFIFTIEGTGALPIKEILAKSTEIFLEKLDELEDQLKTIEIIEVKTV